jgi:hypothetical protein
MITKQDVTARISTSMNRVRAARPLRPRDRGDFFKDMAPA